MADAGDPQAQCVTAIRFKRLLRVVACVDQRSAHSQDWSGVSDDKAIYRAAVGACEQADNWSVHLDNGPSVRVEVAYEARKEPKGLRVAFGVRWKVREGPTASVGAVWCLVRRRVLGERSSKSEARTLGKGIYGANCLT